MAKAGHKGMFYYSKLRIDVELHKNPKKLHQEISFQQKIKFKLFKILIICYNIYCSEE
jgi:hypothetical protein